MLRNHFDEDKKTVDKAVYLEESGEKEDEKSDQDLGRSAVCRCFIRGNSRMSVSYTHLTLPTTPYV